MMLVWCDRISQSWAWSPARSWFLRWPPWGRSLNGVSEFCMNSCCTVGVGDTNVSIGFWGSAICRASHRSFWKSAFLRPFTSGFQALALQPVKKQTLGWIRCSVHQLSFELHSTPALQFPQQEDRSESLEGSTCFDQLALCWFPTALVAKLRPNSAKKIPENALHTM